jgi:hypothetical protein
MLTLRKRQGATPTTNLNPSARPAAVRRFIYIACPSLEHMDRAPWAPAVTKDDFPGFPRATPWTNDRHTLPFMIGVAVRANMIRCLSGILVNVVNKGTLALDPQDPYQACFHFFGGYAARSHILDWGDDDIVKTRGFETMRFMSANNCRAWTREVLLSAATGWMNCVSGAQGR